MLSNQPDAFGIYGDALRLVALFILMSGALLAFLNCWRKGRLDMDEEPKNVMLEIDEYGCQSENNSAERF